MLTRPLAAINVVPIPAAAWLFGSALVGMAGIGYRKKQAQGLTGQPELADLKRALRGPFFFCTNKARSQPILSLARVGLDPTPRPEGMECCRAG